MQRFVNSIVILIGAFLLACIVFVENLSYDAAGCLGFVGFILVILGWWGNITND